MAWTKGRPSTKALARPARSANGFFALTKQESAMSDPFEIMFFLLFLAAIALAVTVCCDLLAFSNFALAANVWILFVGAGVLVVLDSLLNLHGANFANAQAIGLASILFSFAGIFKFMVKPHKHTTKHSRKVSFKGFPNKQHDSPKKTTLKASANSPVITSLSSFQLGTKFCDGVCEISEAKWQDIIDSGTRRIPCCFKVSWLELIKKYLLDPDNKETTVTFPDHIIRIGDAKGIFGGKFLLSSFAIVKDKVVWVNRKDGTRSAAIVGLEMMHGFLDKVWKEFKNSNRTTLKEFVTYYVLPVGKINANQFAVAFYNANIDKLRSDKQGNQAVHRVVEDCATPKKLANGDQPPFITPSARTFSLDSDLSPPPGVNKELFLKSKIRAQKQENRAQKQEILLLAASNTSLTGTVEKQTNTIQNQSESMNKQCESMNIYAGAVKLFSETDAKKAETDAKMAENDAKRAENETKMVGVLESLVNKSSNTSTNASATNGHSMDVMGNTSTNASAANGHSMDLMGNTSTNASATNGPSMDLMGKTVRITKHNKYTNYIGKVTKLCKKTVMVKVCDENGVETSNKVYLNADNFEVLQSN